MRLNCLKSTQNLQPVNSDWQKCIVEERIHRKTLSFQQCHGCKNPGMDIMPYYLFQQYGHNTFFSKTMIEWDCHPDISPPISTKGTMSHVFTRISPGTDSGLKCAWSHLKSPSGAEDTYLPTIRVGWNNTRRTTSLLRSP